MSGTWISRLVLASIIASMVFTGGCATLSVTPPQTLKAGTGKLPATMGIQAAGERLKVVLNDKQNSVAVAASGSLFEKVIMLPPETRFKQPTEIFASHATDYILSISISDIKVSGNLNPYWFASLPLLFFKPLAPIVTFEASVAMDCSLLDGRSGKVLMHKEIMETVTDHFSPNNPEEKVRGLIALSINNGLVKLFGDVSRELSAKPK